MQLTDNDKTVKPTEIKPVEVILTKQKKSPK